jgi:carbon-monoxide dehydrogenase medium subunit
MLLMKQGFASYEHLVDLKRVKSLNGLEIRGEDGALAIGAGVTHRQLEHSSLVREKFSLLAEVEGNVANVRVRNTGTLAGNLAFAEPHSDPATLLIAWGAKLRIRGAKGSREVPAEEFWVGAFDTVIEPGEVIESIEIPRLSDGWSGAYSKFGIHERPSLGVSVFLRRNGSGQIEEARVAVGCIEPSVRRLGEVEEALCGGSDSDLDDNLSDVGALAANGMDPISDLHGSVEYKRGLVAEFTARSVRRALNGIVEEQQ